MTSIQADEGGDSSRQVLLYDFTFLLLYQFHFLYQRYRGSFYEVLPLTEQQI